MSDHTCADCAFWKPVNCDWGICRRRAPVVVGPAAVLADDLDGKPAQPQTVFPMISRDEWCGEWEEPI